MHRLHAIFARWLISLCYHAPFHAQVRSSMDFTSAQIKRLRAEGHRLALKPVVIIGQKGLSENLHHEIDGALSHHELLKLRIPGLDKAGKRELGKQICDHHQATLIESIGNIIVIYRANPEVDRFAAVLTR
jgi:RNA-binding protein